MLKELLKRAQFGDGKSTIELVEKFNPLIKSLAYKLNYDDAYSDLLLDFISLLNRINLCNMHDPTDAHLVSYIVTSMRHSYIRRLTIMRDNMVIPFSALSASQMRYISTSSSYNDVYQEIIVKELASVVTKKEWDIVRLIFYEGYTAAEIARVHGVSRQSVNQVKLRALRKLYRYFTNSR